MRAEKRFGLILMGLLVSLLALAGVLASSNYTAFARIDEVSFNDVVLDANTVTVGAVTSTAVPVKIVYTALRDAKDVKVKLYLEGGGFRREFFLVSERGHIIEGRTYIQKFTLQLPREVDLKDLYKDLTLEVKITADQEESVEEDYRLTLQRASYNILVLSADTPQRVTPGATVPVHVVLENNGNEKLEDIYTEVLIPELGIRERAFVGDLYPQDECDYEDGCDGSSREDSTEKVVYITIPRNAPSGSYTLQIRAYNYDVEVEANRNLIIGEGESLLVTPSRSKTLAIGEEGTFSITFVNPTNSVVVYTLEANDEDFSVEVEDPIIVVPPQSSKKVTLRVSPVEDLEPGVYDFTVKARTENGDSKQVHFTIKVETPEQIKKRAKTTGWVIGSPNTKTVLTIILVIIFIVLLVILLVLLTKKPAQEQYNTEETSYY